MNSWVMTALILAAVFWCLVRIGPRRAQRSLRGLAQRFGGRFQSGGIISRNVAIIPHGSGQIRVKLWSITLLGGRYAAEFRTRWVAGRPEIALSEPTRVVIPGAGESGGSAQIREAASRLREAAAVEQAWVRTARGEFISQAVLHTADIDPVGEWFDATVRFHDHVVAETEAGIEFIPARRTAADADVSCQVCGLAPDGGEIVYCERCGAPHHADCWSYNRGCAIYGCKR